MDPMKTLTLRYGALIHSYTMKQTLIPSNADELIDYIPQGGGGTDFECNWDYMKQNGIEPKKFIMFTDGYPFGSWGDELYCDTCFIIHGNEEIVPFVPYAYYTKEANKKAA